MTQIVTLNNMLIAQIKSSINLQASLARLIRTHAALIVMATFSISLFLIAQSGMLCISAD